MSNRFENAQVILTGVAGFVGSHLCDQLLLQGAEVYGIDNLSTGRRDNISHLHNHPHFHFLEADASESPVNYLPTDIKPDVVFHFASPASPKDFGRLAQEIYQVNGFGTHFLLRYLQDHAPQARFIFASTSEAYGNPTVHPQVETYWGNVNPNGPRSCYDESKRFGEMVCGVFGRKFNLDTRIVRIFNTYGPRLRPGEGRVVSSFIEEALSGRPYSIYGDGSQTRSYCYVSDLVEVILAFALADNGVGETINIGNPAEYTVKETAEMIHSLVSPDSPPQFEYLTLPQDDPVRRQPDITKAKQLLGWEPKVDFIEGLRRTIAHFRDHEQLPI